MDRHVFPLLFSCSGSLVPRLRLAHLYLRALCGWGDSRPSPQGTHVLYFQDRVSLARCSRTVISHQLLACPLLARGPLFYFRPSPREGSQLYCVSPHHTPSQLACSSMTAPGEAPPGLPVDDAKPGVSVRTKGCHQAPQTSHFPSYHTCTMLDPECSPHPPTGESWPV